MLIRQEENTPIGDFFHDSGILPAFNTLEETVDEFDVDTEVMTVLCDRIIDCLKGLKAQIKKTETAWSREQAQKKVSSLINEGFE